MRPHLLIVTLTALACILTCGSARADSIDLASVARGSYGRSGFHNDVDLNYHVGASDGYRNFFVFDLAQVSGHVTSARLELANHAYSATAHVPFTLYDVLTPSSVLTQYQSAAPEIFEDLGSGEVYGHVNDAADGPVVSIELNSEFLSAINSRGPGLFALGGRLNDTPYLAAYAFSGTGGSDSTPRLILETGPANSESPAVPLPSVALLGSVLISGLAAARRGRA
jgi:hypothetical protein